MNREDKNTLIGFFAVAGIMAIPAFTGWVGYLICVIALALLCVYQLHKNDKNRG